MSLSYSTLRGARHERQAMDLSEDDVLQIIRYLDESNFNELRLQLGDLRIVVSRSGTPAPLPTSIRPNSLPTLRPPLRRRRLRCRSMSRYRNLRSKPPPLSHQCPNPRPLRGTPSITSPMLGTFTAPRSLELSFR